MVAAQAALAAEALALALKRIQISTGGVAYFEHEASVDADATLALTVRLDQVDDVLKSLIVYDARGGVGSVGLPGQEPLADAFRELPFPREALASTAALLRSLPGSQIRVLGPRPLEGRVLGVVDEETIPNAAQTRTLRHRISIQTPELGLRQFVLEDAEQIEFADPALQKQLASALVALAANRARERRTLSISLHGEARRVVRIGYLVEAPLWKTSYRLSIPESDGAGKGLLQAWAVVENLSGADWDGVDLTLVSGHPVTLRQALYRPHYVPRPEVPVDTQARVVPRVDSGTLTAEAPSAAPRPAPAARLAARPNVAERKEVAAQAYGGAIAAPTVPTAAEEAATQVLFHVPGKVRLGTGNTLMIPIANREVATERLSLWQAASGATRPLAAVRLRNETGSGLPPGVLSIYQHGSAGGNAYVGDARLGSFPAGESRLVSFAVDDKMQVASEQSNGERIVTGKVSRGVLQLEVVDQRTTRYRVKAPAQEARTLVIEHPRLAGWRLATPGEREVEQTLDAYRVRTALAPGEAKEIVVVQEFPRESRIALAESSVDLLLGYARNTVLGAGLRQALESIAALKQDVERQQRAVTELEAQRSRIVADQERVRNNLGRVPSASDLYKRYLDTLREQEDRLQAQAAQHDEAQAKLQSARNRLADAIERLEI